MTDTGLVTVAGQGFKYDLGTFEVGHFGEQSAMGRTLSAMEVVAWNHGADGEAEFWPSGDHAGVSILCADRSAVTGSDLLALDRALDALGGDDLDNFLRIHCAVNVHGMALDDITPERLDALCIRILRGTNFPDLWRAASQDIFDAYYAGDYRPAEETDYTQGTIALEDILEWECWHVEELRFGGDYVLLIVAQ